MKKTMMIALMSLMCLFCATTASALEPAAAAAGTGAVSSVAYEAHVITDIAGRAGAATPNGAKGIVFESLFKDKLNFKNLFNGLKTQFTKSSTAPQVDLVSMTDSGKVAARYQCKDAPNSVSKVLNQVKSGKYQQAQMVGTSETAAAYNAEAAKNGISKTMTDSGISTKTTTRIADKALGNVSSVSNLANFAAKAGGIGAAVEGGICLVESISRGDDAYTMIGHVTAGAGKGFVTGSVAAVAGEVATAAVVSAGASGAAIVILPVVTTVGVGYLVSQVADGVVNEAAISAAAENLVQFASESGLAIADSVSNIFD